MEHSIISSSMCQCGLHLMLSSLIDVFLYSRTCIPLSVPLWNYLWNRVQWWGTGWCKIKLGATIICDPVFNGRGLAVVKIRVGATIICDPVFNCGGLAGVKIRVGATIFGISCSLLFCFLFSLFLPAMSWFCGGWGFRLIRHQSLHLCTAYLFEQQQQ